MCWADNIKKLRTKLLVTQHELANLLGVSYVSLMLY